MTFDVQQAMDLQEQAHSLAQVRSLIQLVKLDSLEARHALKVASHLVDHGFASADRYLLRLRSQLKSEWASSYIDRLLRRHQEIQGLPGLAARLQDAETVHHFYAPDGFHFIRGTTRPDVAVVVFTTVFNNFGFSNIILDTILSTYGVSRLFLKDTSPFYYMRGVKGLASDLGELPAALEALLRERGIRNYIITGYSSGGYASLYTARRTTPRAYVGYAIATDLSGDGRAEPPRYYRELRDAVPASLMLSAEAVMNLSRPSFPIMLFHGDQPPRDRDHAVRLSGFDKVTISEVRESGHEVTRALLERGQFRAVFDAHLGDTAAIGSGQDHGG